jgi:hypothetical protein
MLLPTRADTWRVTLSLNGINFGVFDVKEGGDVDSDETTYKPGGMEDPVGLGGSRTVENVTLRRLYRLGRDHEQSQRLIDFTGKARAVITVQPLDIDGNTWGRPIVYRGVLRRVSFPDHDSNSGDAALLELEITIDGLPTGQAPS